MRGLLAVCLTIAAVSPAQADGTTVYPLAAEPGLAVEAAQLDRAIAKAIDGTLSSIPIEDAAGLLDCDIETSRCLEAVVRSATAQRVVFGAVSRSGDALVISLTRFAPGDREQRTIRITATTEAARRTQLIAALAPMFELALPVRPVVVRETPMMPEPIAKPPSRTASWLLVGSGLAVAGAGATVLWTTRSLRAEIVDAPLETRDQITRVRDLEAREQRRTQIGYGLVAAGGAVTLIGAIHAVVTGGSPERRIAVQPIAGGAAIAFTGRLP